MARARTAYRCTECGANHPKWAGRCDACGAWNAVGEEVAGLRVPAWRAGAVAPVVALGAVAAGADVRLTTGLAEFDFVLGGGLVPGAMVLVGGEPGVGKSTLLLQVAARLEARGHRALYVSGEESPVQVKLRAERLAEPTDTVAVLGETSLDGVLAVVERARPRVVVLDSIQTVFSADLEGAPGNVGQVRECAARLMRFAKASGVTVLVIGHVTKGGGIAGPKTLEHVVDTVLYFEGDPGLDHRVLRATKNRFGSADEIGVFRMTGAGLEPVGNPSSLFLGDRDPVTSGSAITALVEGSRPVLVEVQALAARAGFGTPQRVATGVDGRRLALLLAVLEKRAGLPFAQLDAFINVVGGLRLHEPAGDLAVAAALASSVHDTPLPAGSVFVGEVGLGGEIRPVSQLDRRIAEAEQLGFRRVYVGERALPSGGRRRVEVLGVRDIAAFCREAFA